MTSHCGMGCNLLYPQPLMLCYHSSLRGAVQLQPFPPTFSFQCSLRGTKLIFWSKDQHSKNQLLLSV
jgi:hypothetical protein